MPTEDRDIRQKALTSPSESLAELLASANDETLDALLRNASLDEPHVCQLLERKDLPGKLLEEISKRKEWRPSYRIRRALAAHPHTPRLIAMRMLRDLHVMDLVRISLLPTSAGELRRLAEDRVLGQLVQLPLGHRLTLARRGSSRIVGGLIVEGPEQVARIALDNARLTESQLLKSLTKDALTGRIIATIATHSKWSKLINVRVAILRHPQVAADVAASLVPELPRREIQDLLGELRLSSLVRDRLLEEVSRRGA
jgi:hypothetical protein